MIEVVDYDPSWPSEFERLRRLYADALSAADVPTVSIEHVGSTAVPGLAAKPLLDIDIVVVPDQVERASDVLVGLGFTPQGELGIPLRWAFAPPDGWTRTNTYVVIDGCLSLRNHFAVRDALRADPGLRDRYGAVKRQAAVSAADLEEYGRGKNAMVQDILRAAGLTDEERASIDASQVPSFKDVPG